MDDFEDREEDHFSEFEEGPKEENESQDISNYESNDHEDPFDHLDDLKEDLDEKEPFYDIGEMDDDNPDKEKEDQVEDKMEDLDADRTQKPDNEKPGPMSFLRSKLGKIHPAFLIAAIMATIVIEWVMIVLQSYEDLPTLWIGLGIYLVVTAISVALLTHIFSTRYRTLMSVLTLNSLLLTIPLGAIISLVTGYTYSQLFSPQWLFTHDFVYIMIVNQLVVTSILMLGILWKARREVAVADGFEDEEPLRFSEPSSLTHDGDMNVQNHRNSTKGLVNGLTNGLSPSTQTRIPTAGMPGERGMVNGLTNGNSSKGPRNPIGTLHNELGMVNGLTNGLERSSRGYKDNYRSASQLAKNDRQLFWKRTKQIVFPIAIFLIIVGILILPYIHVPDNGYMAGRNWSGVASYSDDSEGVNSYVDIVEYSATYDDTYLWGRVKVNGEILGSSPPDTSTIFMFIDSDRDSATGYSIGGMGSDYMIRISGFERRISESTVLGFSETRSSDDWNGWLIIESAETIIEDDTLQTRVPMSVFGSKTAPLVYFGIIDSQGVQDYSEAPIDTGSEGVLIVNQKNVAPDIMDRGQVDVLSLEMTARGKSMVIESMDLALDRGEILPISTPIRIEKDETRIVNVRLNTSELVMGELVEVEMNPRDIVTDNGTVFVNGIGMKAYFGSPPPGIKIDGAFGDWMDEPEPRATEEAKEAVNPNIDITEYQNSRAGVDIFFYLKVDGSMMGGVKIPQLSEEEVPPKIRPKGEDRENKFDIAKADSEFVPLPELYGYDAAFVFIDTDDDRNTGYRPTQPFVFPIGADYMIGIKGREGIIKSSDYYRFVGAHNQWAWHHLGSVPSASDETRLETSITLSMLDIHEPIFDVFIQMTDWNQDEDFSDTVIGEGPVNYHSSEGTRKNGGFPDGDIDTIDGGSCAGAFGCHDLDTTQIPISLSWNPAGPYDPGQTGIQITVTVNMDGAASGSEAGMAMRIGPSGGQPHYGIENDGWVIESDPHTNQNNFILESGLVGQGPQSFVWTVTAPTTAGTYYVEASIHYDNGGGGQEYNLTAESAVSVIPEFQEVLPPLLSILTVMVVGKRIKRRD